MAEKIILIDGKEIHEALLTDLAQVMDHSYDFDELFALYGDWCRRGEHFVDDYAGTLFPPIVADAVDDFIALRNAMINLYCAADRATRGLERYRVIHMAYCPDDHVLAITVR